MPGPNIRCRFGQTRLRGCTVFLAVPFLGKDYIMRHTLLKAVVLATAIGFVAMSAAKADCESDLLQLEKAYKTPNLTSAAKSALDDAKAKAVSALKKDDDATCHKAIAEALPKAGLKLK
jgi:hypothetical protein